MKLKDKVAIVTGATKGIGEACAYEYAKEGAKVVVIGRCVPSIPLKGEFNLP